VVAAASSRVSGRKNGDYGESELWRDSRQEFRRQGEENDESVGQDLRMVNRINFQPLAKEQNLNAVMTKI
jgi:hypothetical protein